MTSLRQFKTFGLALLAVAAIGAATASCAQAGTFTASSYPATVTGAPSFHMFFTEIGIVNCRPSMHGELAAASEELTLTPTFEPVIFAPSSCLYTQTETHANTNGCDFRMHAGEQLEADLVSGTMDIVCPEGKELEFEITSNPVCHLTVPSQENLAGVPGTPPAVGIRFRNETPSAVRLQINPGGIRYNLTGGCSVTGEFETGVYSGFNRLSGEGLSVDG